MCQAALLFFALELRLRILFEENPLLFLTLIYDPAAVSDDRGLARSPRPVVPPRTFLQEALTDSAVCCDGCGRRSCSRVRRRCLCRPALLRRGDRIGETGCTTMRLRLRWAEEFGGQLPRRVGSEFANVHARACRRILLNACCSLRGMEQIPYLNRIQRDSNILRACSFELSRI